jgi:hypothetical protein
LRNGGWNNPAYAALQYPLITGAFSPFEKLADPPPRRQVSGRAPD